MNLKDFIRKNKRYLLNKYLITCLIAALVLVCCGEQSLIQRAKRNRQIRQLQTELNKYQNRIDYYNDAIQNLEQSPENRERFAREQYFMHANNEDIYLINEDD